MTRTLKDVLSGNGEAKYIGEEASCADLIRFFAQSGVDATCVRRETTVDGIVTVRDVVKLVARREDLDTIRVGDFMTADPVVLPADASTEDAIAVMQAGGFRHVPVVDDKETLLGLVDALELVFDAISSVQDRFIPTRRAFSFFRSTAQILQQPTVNSISGAQSDAAILTVEDSLLHACEVMTARYQSAVAVTDADGTGNLAGIVTSSNVIRFCSDARRRDLDAVRLGEVMTRNPDCVRSSDPLLMALEKMQTRGYRHLPVLDDDTHHVVSIINVLQVTADALLNSGDGARDREANGGYGLGAISSAPSSIWSYFFSGSGRAAVQVPPRASPRASTVRHAAAEVASSPSQVAAGSDDSVVFKFKDKSGDYRRVLVPRSVQRGSYDRFQLDVRRRFGAEASSQLKIKYFDEDGDEVRVASDEDFNECITAAVHNRWKTIRAVVREVRTVVRDVSAVTSSTAPSSDLAAEEEEASVADESRASPTEASSRAEDGSLQSSHPPPVPLQDRLDAALRKLRAGEVEASIAGYEEAIAQEPTSAQAHCGKAFAELILHLPDDALADYRRAKELASVHMDKSRLESFRDMCNAGITEALIELRRYEEAGKVLSSIQDSKGREETVQAFLDELAASEQSARKALEAGEAMEAVDLFTGAVRIDTTLAAEIGRPRDARLNAMRAKCYIASDDLEMALEDFDQALQHDPEQRDALLGRAQCLEKLERPKEAKAAFHMCLNVRPDDEEARQGFQRMQKIVSDSETKKIADLGSILKGLVPPET